MQRAALALGLLGFSVVCCGDAGEVGPRPVDDAGPPGSSGGPSPECEGLGPLTIEAKPARVREGGTVTLTATGGSGRYAFATEGSGSGGTLDGTAFIAGTKPAVDTFVVTDETCQTTAKATVSVVPPFRVAPENAVLRPGTTFAILTEGLLGKAVFQLQASTAESTLDAAGNYKAGSVDGGRDTIVVRDDVGGDEVTLSYEIRAGALLTTAYPRIALPPGSSIPLRATGGSDTIVWEKLSGPGTVLGDRYTSPANASAPARVRGRDTFTKDVVELDVWPLTPANAAAPVTDALGMSVAWTTRSGDALAAFGAPGFQGGLGRAYTFDPTTQALSAALEGAATPLHRGRSVGSGVTFTDFNGDGRPDLVVGAPELVVPTSAVRAAEITPFYATDRAACVPEAAESKGGVLVSLGQADGTFRPAYRLWRDVAGLGDLGFDVAGGFDFNGDGLFDVAALRSDGLDVFLGRAADDASLAKLTMACDAITSIPKLPAPTVALTALGDINGDGCGEVAVGYHDATHGGVAIVFGFDTTGTRCGGRTTPTMLRIAADGESGETYLGLGTSLAVAGRFLGGTTPWLAVGASKLNVGDTTRPGVMLLDLHAIAASRPANGTVVRGLAGMTTHVLAATEAFDGFGQALAGGVDLTGDGIVDLVVGAPAGSFASTGSGVALVFAGGSTSTGALAPHLLISGDDGAPAGLGRALGLLPAAGSRRALLGIGSPTSARNGAGNGAAYVLALPGE